MQKGCSCQKYFSFLMHQLKIYSESNECYSTFLCSCFLMLYNVVMKTFFAFATLLLDMLILNIIFLMFMPTEHTAAAT